MRTFLASGPAGFAGEPYRCMAPHGRSIRWSCHARGGFIHAPDLVCMLRFPGAEPGRNAATV
jgi:hypothetical protein